MMRVSVKRGLGVVRALQVPHTSYLGFLAAWVCVFTFGLLASPVEAGENLKDWGKQFPNAASRFQVLPDFNNEAVLDKETQLVWERLAGDTDGDEDVDDDDRVNWNNARGHCANRVVGGRKGWKLSSFDQLASLVDPSEANPALPANHPFIGVQSAVYWSATTDAVNPFNAWSVVFDSGDLFSNGKGFTDHAWCVRGGQSGPDAY